MQKLISILIPTRNRQKYCVQAVRQIANLNISELEIVVQDNSDDTSLEKELHSIQADIHYHHHPGELSFVDNFNEAILQANGKYLCMIGDDDGILPNIIKVTEMADKEGYDAVIPGLNSVYCWPSEKPFIKNAEDGYLCLSYIRNQKTDIDCKTELSKLMEQAGQNYQSLNLPRLYHGIVKAETVYKIKEKNGSFFGGLTPDIYMAVALCFVCTKTVKIDYPVTISGICPRSGSSDSATGKHTGRLEDAPHFRGHKAYNWDPKAPRIYSVESIWAETAMHALHDFCADDLYFNFRIDILDGICLKKYPQFSTEIKEHAEKNGISVWKMRREALWINCRTLVKRVIRRFLRRKNDVKKFYDVKDIEDACLITANTIRDMEKI